MKRSTALRVARAMLDDAGVNMPNGALARVVDTAPRLDRDTLGAHLAGAVAAYRSARRDAARRLPYRDPTANKAIRRLAGVP